MLTSTCVIAAAPSLRNNLCVAPVDSLPWLPLSSWPPHFAKKRFVQQFPQGQTVNLWQNQEEELLSVIVAIKEMFV